VSISADASGAEPAHHVLVAGGDADSRERRESQLRAAGYRVSLARTGFEAIVSSGVPPGFHTSRYVTASERP
jgi:hypothetical protein